MRRFLTLVCLLCLAIPAGISISGCSRNPGANYCNGLGYGMKITDVASITLAPVTTGISMAYGQTRQVSSPSALTCKGTGASVTSYTYGTTNNQLVDISPTGNICAGTWNRNSGGGIADYTICNPPNPLPSTGGLPYGIAYLTASAQAVTSNPVEVFVHAMVTSVSLVTESSPTSINTQKCFSQGVQATIDAQACFVSNNTQYELCAPSTVTSNYACPGGLPPGVTSVPNCTAAIGALSYSVGNPTVASVTTNTTTNLVTITALQPGTTAITASVAGSGSSAGYFSTCPPASISVTLANGSTAGTITQGVTQNLTTNTIDTQGNPITGLSLTYQSTDPIDISASSTGAITTSLPGVASVYAICQPPSCNSGPINEIGIYGTGLPVSSNPVTITTPGTASDYVWFAAPGQSQYVVPVELVTGSVGGSVGSTIRLPYVPNSMVMDRLGNNIYFGSPHELMAISTANNTITASSTAVPGVVLAVSPSNSQLLINDQVRQIFYLYNISGGSYTAFGGMGTAAAWTPDSNTLYVVDSAAQNNTPANIAAGITSHTDALYVYNANTGWISSLLACSSSDPAEQKKPYCDPSLGITPSNGAQSLAITIPSVGAFFSGSPTVAHTWCPTGTVGNYASMIFYPQSDSVTVQTDVLAATTNGQHILGAALTNSGVTLNDIGLDISPAECSLTTPLSTNGKLLTTSSLNVNANAASVNQVVPSPVSNLAFITYFPPATGATTGASLPFYVPQNYTPGNIYTATPVKYVTLAGNSAITAPLTGAFTPDNKLFFVSTAGDNMIHYISVPQVTTNPANADTQQISPNLPSCTPISAGGIDLGCAYSGPNPGTAIVPATAIAVKPRSTT
jgi:sugar lactone lactonase YvrE